MPINLSSCLLNDFLYQQDKKTYYAFKDDKFIMVDRDEIADSICPESSYFPACFKELI
ncbi:hypothetical protein R84B8_02833 [Treponema sp. R8-4-B8]